MVTTRSLNYEGGLPTGSGVVTLFDSTAVPALKSQLQARGFNLYLLSLDNSQAGTLKGYYSMDGSTPSIEFYSSAAAASNSTSTNDYHIDIDGYVDVKFTWTNGGVNQTVFDVAQSLSDGSGEGAGVLTNDQVSTIGALTSTDPDGSIFHIYVSAVNGNDANAGTSSSTPVATWATALARLPKLRFGPVIIHLGAGTYNPTTAPMPSTMAMGSRCPIYVWGDGAGQSGDDGFTVVATDVAGGSSTDLTVKATVASTSLYTGFTMEWTTGSNVGQKRTIRNSTTTDIVPVCRWEVTPTAGDAFRILKPAAVFSYSDTCLFAQGIGNGQVESPLVLVNVTFTDSASSTALQVPLRAIRFVKCHILAYGVHSLNGTIQLKESTMHAGALSVWQGQFGRFPGQFPTYLTSTATSYAAIALSDLGLADTRDWHGWGLSGPYLSGASREPLNFDRSFFIGFFVADFLLIPQQSGAVLAGGGIETTLQGQLQVQGYLRISGTQGARLFTGAGQTAPGVPFRINTSFGGAIITSKGSEIWVDELDIVCASASSTAFTIEGNAHFPLTENGGTTGLTISVTGGIGLIIRNGGRAHFTTSTTAKYTFTSTNTGGTGLLMSNNGVLTNLAHFTMTNGAISTSYGCTWAMSGVQIVGSCTSLAVAGSRYDWQGNGASSTLTITPTTTASVAILVQSAGILVFDNLVLTINGQISVKQESTLQCVNAMGSSVVTCTAATGGLLVDCSCVDLSGITSGTFTVNQSTAFRAAVRLKGGRLYCSNTTFACTGTTYGVDLSNGGQMFVAGQPSNCVGSTKDFIDEAATTNAYNDTELSAADTCIFRGQHPSGTYSSTTAATGAAFVQRLS